MTLRQRVLAYLALAAIASCALTVGVGVVLVRQRVAAQRMKALETQAGELALVLGARGLPAGGRRVYALVGGRVRRLGPARSAAVLAALPPGQSAEGTVEVAGRSLIFAARPTGAGGVVLVRSAALAFSEWRPFLASLILAGLGGALLAAALAWLLARRLTRPLGELSAATRRLAAGESGITVPARGEDELAQLGRSFNAMSQALERAQAGQRRFLESVSHELKTPLTSIRGYAEAVGEGAIAPAEAGRVILAESGRLERLVGDLLDLARLQRADFAVARETVDLAALARQAVARHAPRARELGIRLAGESAEGALALADPDRLLQATSNLIENALRLTPAGGEVHLSTGSGQITVEDTGPGLAEEDIARAFERFYLYERYRSERPVGSGLGLAIVQQLVAAMGGSVRAGRGAHGGARFTISLPVPGDGRPADQPGRG